MKDRRQTKAVDVRLEQLSSELKAGKIQRRDFLRRAVAIGLSASAAYSALSASEVSAQSATTMAIGEQSPTTPLAPPIYHPLPAQHPLPGQGATLMVGEEVDVTPMPKVTTRAIGEETATQPTTLAVGEESTSPPVTMAVGEEGAAPPIANPTTQAQGEESIPSSSYLTTQAAGEEVLSPPISNPTTLAFGEESPVRPPPKVTTFALGEEVTTPPPVSPSTRRLGEESNPPSATTMAEGEEGPIICFPKQYNAPPVNTRPRTGPIIQQPQSQPWRNFRRW